MGLTRGSIENPVSAAGGQLQRERHILTAANHFAGLYYWEPGLRCVRGKRRAIWRTLGRERGQMGGRMVECGKYITKAETDVYIASFGFAGAAGHWNSQGV